MSQAAYVAAVLADTPAAFWQLQDVSGNPADSSGNGHNMTATNGPLVYQEQGPFGSDFAIDFGPAANAQQQRFSTVVDNMSVEAWIQLVSFGTSFKGPFGNNRAGAGWDVDITAALKLTVVVQGIAILASSVNALQSRKGNPLLPVLGVGGGSANTWAQVVVVRNAGIWSYYFNGALDTANAGNSTPNAIDATCLCQIGNVGGSGAQRFAYVSYYESALSAAQVAAHYAAALV